MPTTVIEALYGTAGSATWQAVGSNRIIFTNTLGSAGSASAVDSMPVNTWNKGTHVGSSAATPVDVCTNPHVPNYEYVTSTTWKINNAAAVTVSDAAVSVTQASFRWHFNEASPTRTVQNVRLYVFDNTTVTTQATGVDIALFVTGNSMTAWGVVNDASTAGPAGFTTGNIGGDNASERITGSGLDRASAGNDHYWYCAASLSIENAGVKTGAFGIYLEYV